MDEVIHKKIKNTRMTRIWKDITYGDTHTYLIEINELQPSKSYTIKIQSSNLVSSIEELLSKKKDRLYLSYANHDIDLYQKGKAYELSWSPHSGLYMYFSLSKKEVNQILSALKIECSSKEEATKIIGLSVLLNEVQK